MNFPTTYPVTCHTDHVGLGSTFVVIKGYKEDGMRYIPQAIAKGATTIVLQEDHEMPADICSYMQQAKVHVEVVNNSRQALAQLSAQAAGFPAQKLRILGITGTKGKTTSSFLLEHLLRTAGYRTALLGTVKNSIMDHHLGTGLTTQQPDYLHQFFALCVREQIDYVVMEVAAQGLSLHRVDGIAFDGIIFTNFSQEHGEFYPTIEDYFAAKKIIFNHVRSQAPVIINADDRWCQQLLDQATYTGFGLQSPRAHVTARSVGDIKTGIVVDIATDIYQRIACPTLLGLFNVYNVVGVYVLARQLKIAPATIAHAFATFTKVPGRLERYQLHNGATAVIDYAHNPSSFESVLSTLRQLSDHVVVVFGCGGDRDVSKRPVMGAIAARYADLVVLTADNPRSEDVEKIIDQILVGIDQTQRHKIVRYTDRKEAIEYAYRISTKNSIIALLGKGPDEYQQIGQVKLPFSEAAIIKELR